MEKQSLVIVGNGMAPGRMLEYLHEQKHPFDVTIFNAEPRVNYNRLMLSPVLSGEKTYSDIVTHDDCLLYTSPSPRDLSTSRMPSSA